MADPGLGQLDMAEGTAELDDGTTVARIELRDTREQEVIEVPMPGGNTGLKPGRITGFVAIRFIEVDDPALRKHLGQHVQRERSEDYDFEVVLSDGTRIGPCAVGGPLGSESPGDYWFVLDF
ncbi:MAG TPA: hypothetical protein VLI94_11045 [Solirubrobacterales bacterium]|nr:hypothetical protein [Solirubrobacterales bacterium]